MSSSLSPIVLAQRVEGLARVARAHVSDVQHDRQQLQVRVEALARELDHLERLFDSLKREVLRLGREQRVLGCDQRVDRQQSQRRRAVDQHEVVVVGDLSQRLAQRELAAHLAAEHQLRLGQAEVGGDDAAVVGLLHLCGAGQHLADGRRRVRVDVEVIGEVALRVEVDGQHVQPDAPEHVSRACAPWSSYRCRPSARGL